MGGWVASFTALLQRHTDTILSILYSLCTYMYIYMGLGKAGFNLGVLVTEGGPTQPTGDEHGPNLKENINIFQNFPFLKSHDKSMKEHFYSLMKTCQPVRHQAFFHFKEHLDKENLTDRKGKKDEF